MCTNMRRKRVITALLERPRICFDERVVSTFGRKTGHGILASRACGELAICASSHAVTPYAMATRRTTAPRMMLSSAFMTFKSASGTVPNSHSHNRACIKSNTHCYVDSEPNTITKPQRGGTRHRHSRRHR